MLGANGSGKSTLLRIAAGRDTPSSGQVGYGGRVMSEDDPVVRTEIAVVGDMVSAYPDLTVREHLQLVSVAHGAGHLAADLVDRALAECRLEGHAGALPGSLSSGQLQDLQLATVLVRPRRLMVLDEPEQRLDPAARRWLAGLLRAREEAGAAVLLATHHTELAAAVADHVIVLSDGAIIAGAAAGCDAGGDPVTVNQRPDRRPGQHRGRPSRCCANCAGAGPQAGGQHRVLGLPGRGHRGQLGRLADRHRLPGAAPPAAAHRGHGRCAAAERAARRADRAGPAGAAGAAAGRAVARPGDRAQATVDWLLGTPVDRRRLLRPRFRWAAAGALLVGAVAGIVPAAALVALGLGGPSLRYVLRLAGRRRWCRWACSSRSPPDWRA